MAGDGEGIDAHAHGLGGDGAELLPVWTVLVDGLHLGGANRPGTHAGQPHQLLGVGGRGVNAPELAAGVAEEDEEVVGGTLLHLLRLREREQITLASWFSSASSNIKINHDIIYCISLINVDKRFNDEKLILYLNYLVFLCLVDLSRQAAARQSVVNDELVGLEARFFEKLRTWKHKHVFIALCKCVGVLKNCDTPPL